MRFRIRLKKAPPRFRVSGCSIKKLTLPVALLAVVLSFCAAPANAQCPTPGGVCATPGKDGAGGTLTGIKNAYYPATASAAAAATTITLGTANANGAQTAIAIGDLLLVIQMQGADITSTNSTAYGDGSTGSGYTVNTNLTAGRYEFVKAASAVTVTGGATRVLTITGGGTGTGLINSYVNGNATGTHGARRFQVIRVPQYSTATLSSGLTAAAWNGTSGGVLAIDVSTTLTLGGTVSVDGLGFRGGGPQQLGGTGTAMTSTDFVTAVTNNFHGNKGEGIAGTPEFVLDSGALLDNGADGLPNGSRAKGAPGNAGGGGTDSDPSANDQNSGGGGGANGGDGGTGGLTWLAQVVDGGLGGSAFAQASACRIIMGGGGGSGTRNNDTGVTLASSGSAGGGIVIIRTRFLMGTGTITANGADAFNNTDNDGGGGAGAGGTIVFSALTSSAAALTVSAHGGKGGDAWDASGPGTNCVCGNNNHHGPGGGGGGGIVYLSSAPASVDVSGGANGTSTTDGAAFGATSGAAGTSVTNMTPDQIPGVFSGAQCTPTAVAVEWFKAETHHGVVRLKWRTGYEVDNLGFNVYRDLNGERVKVNPSLVAGSALITRNSTLLAAGRTYSWLDNISGRGRDALYWLEDIDLHGKRTWHGPVGVEPSVEAEALSAADSDQQAMLLAELGRGQTQGERIVTQPALGPQTLDSNESKTVAKATAKSSTLAGMPAIKISVRTNGWYSVTKQSLVGLGLDPKADPRTVQVFLNGNEIPISVLGTTSAYTVEFYGVGANTESTDLQVYWLIWGFQQGMRIPALQGNGSTSSATSFPYTVQVLERSVYFPGVLNGEKENFFGSAVTSSSAADASIPVTNLDTTSADPVTLQVALQGVTEVGHQVQVSLNGTTVGEADFSNLADGVAAFSVPASLLRQGANDVSLLALGGDSDVSLIDFVSLTYRHTFMADANSLQLTAPGSQMLTVGGFTNPNIRAFDITNPNSAIQLSGVVKQVGASFSVTFSDPSPGSRTVFAFSNDQARPAASLDYNTPSNWGQPAHGADMVIITQKSFFNNLAPLVTRRSAQGLSVAVIDVVDLYDEFNFGQKDPQAIRSFLAYASANWRPAPRWVLLAGDASYDPKNYLGFGNFDLVPSKLIPTQQLETASDDWFVDFTGAGFPSMAIGRLPVRTTQETDLMVGKILGYENTGQHGGALLVSDVSDDYNFAGESLSVQALIPSALGTTTIDRGTDATAESDLTNGINQGQKIVNYAGHGSLDLWRGDLLTNSSALSLVNGQNLPFFSLMTCLNGAFDDPVLDSLAESLLKAPQGGAVAVWASSGITDPSSQQVMAQNFYKLLFGSSSPPGGGGNGGGGNGGNGGGNGGNGGGGIGGGPTSGLTIGEAAARAKAGVPELDVRTTWILFGDPAMRLKQ